MQERVLVGVVGVETTELVRQALRELAARETDAPVRLAVCESVATTSPGRTRSMGPLLRSRRTEAMPEPRGVDTRCTGTRSRRESQAASRSTTGSLGRR